MIQQRIDAQVANIVAAADVLHELVVSTDAAVLSDSQLYELQKAQFQIAHMLWAEPGYPDADDSADVSDPPGGMEDEPSLTADQEQARIEGDQRDEMNRLPEP
jgi:hypothetical protein